MDVFLGHFASIDDVGDWVGSGGGLICLKVIDLVAAYLKAVIIPTLFCRVQLLRNKDIVFEYVDLSLEALATLTLGVPSEWKSDSLGHPLINHLEDLDWDLLLELLLKFLYGCL